MQFDNQPSELQDLQSDNMSLRNLTHNKDGTPLFIHSDSIPVTHNPYGTPSQNQQQQLSPRSSTQQQNFFNQFSGSIIGQTTQAPTQVSTSQNATAAVPQPPAEVKIFPQTIHWMFIKNKFHKILKRLQEDESSIWFDNLEEEINDYKEIKELYDLKLANPADNHFHAETSLEKAHEEYRNQIMKNHMDLQSQIDNDSLRTQMANEVKEYRDFDLAQQTHGRITPSPNARNYMVKQRRNHDKWGRMMLLKPNRSATRFEHWKFYDFYVQDILQQILAVSWLKDEDLPDCVQPLLTTENDQENNNFKDLERDVSQSLNKQRRSSYSPKMPPTTQVTDTDDNETNEESKAMQEQDPSKINDQFESLRDTLKSQTNSGSRSSGASAVNSPKNKQQQEEPYQNKPLPYSLVLQNIRESLMDKIGTNKLLKRVLIDHVPLPANFFKPTNDETSQKELKHREQLVKNRQYQEKLIEQVIEIEQSMTLIKTIAFDAVMITPEGSNYGKIIVTTNYFAFISKQMHSPDSYVYVDHCDSSQVIKRKRLILRWQQMEELWRRKVFQVYQGIDIYTNYNKCYTFNLCTLKNCDEFFKAVNSIKELDKTKFTQLEFVTEPIKTFQKKDLAHQWYTGQRSNQEFLLLVNKYSGRSFNDLLQYPIFPWVIDDYQSLTGAFQQKLAKGECYRDLSLHLSLIGPQKKVDDIKDKYKRLCKEIKAVQEKDDSDFWNPQFPDGTTQKEPFWISDGMSNSMYTAMYLCRLEPFSNAALRQNDFKRDQRYFKSFEEKWHQDVQSEQNRWAVELIPEHFYMPEILMNVNSLWMDYTNVIHTNRWNSCNSVFLPKWSFNAFDFIRQQRECLESKFVTASLDKWIQLIFGCNQKSDEHKTVYPYVFYEEWHQDSKNRKCLTNVDMTRFQTYMAPAKLFDQNILKTEAKKAQEFEEQKQSRFSEVRQENEKKEKQASNQTNNQEDQNAPRHAEKVIKMLIDYHKDKVPKEQRQQLKNMNEQERNLYQIRKRNDSKMNYIMDYSELNSKYNIVHILFNNKKKCLVFVNVPDDPSQSNSQRIPSESSIDPGNLFVYSCQESQISDGLKDQGCDLGLRYEHVFEDLHNVFQAFSDSESREELYVCGYLDNSIRIFNLSEKAKDGKPPPCHTMYKHQARVTCIKFSKDQKYLLTCDANGLINHYAYDNSQKSSKKEHFPFTLMYRIHDQHDEIVAIDINQTLDLFVTVSKDGTVALRSLKTAELWQIFPIYCKVMFPRNEEKTVTGFNQIFRHIDTVKLSLHGYIVILGSSIKTHNYRYLVYSLNGDYLLKQMHEKIEIKACFLNHTEDQLILAGNFQMEENVKCGMLRVIELYGLKQVANLSHTVYRDIKANFKKNNKQDKNPKNFKLAADGISDMGSDSGRSGADVKRQKSIVPPICGIDLKRGESNFNICFETKTKQKDGSVKVQREMICFDTTKIAIWCELIGFALVPNSH